MLNVISNTFAFGASRYLAASSTHPEYDYYKDIWVMIDDFVLGEKQVKSKGEDYLPKLPQWTADQYHQYRDLAPFTNFTVRTINALLGAMFLKDPLVILPESVKYMNDDADGKGNSLHQVVRRVSLEAIKKGRSGLYVDFPKAIIREGATRPTAADTANMKARIVMFDAMNILDWNEDENGLSMVLLQEIKTEMKENVKSYVVYERLLELVNGVYTVSLYKQGQKPETGEIYVPKDYQGNTFDYIPFFFNGAVNNDATCDNSPVYEIVSKNKTHYQLEAEIMRSIRTVGSPMATISVGDMNVEQFLNVNDLKDNALEFGVSRGLIVGSGGGLNLVQAKANDMAQTKADRVLTEAMMLGARLVTKSSGRATAEQIKIETSAENAIINSIAKNVEHTMQRAILTAQRFMSPIVEDLTFSMNTEFFSQNPDSQILLFAKEMLADPSMTFAPTDMFTLLKNSGLIDANRSIEDVTAEVEIYRKQLEKMQANMAEMIDNQEKEVTELEIDNGTDVSANTDNRLK